MVVTLTVKFFMSNSLRISHTSFTHSESVIIGSYSPAKSISHCEVSKESVRQF